MEGVQTPGSAPWKEQSARRFHGLAEGRNTNSTSIIVLFIMVNRIRQHHTVPERAGTGAESACQPLTGAGWSGVGELGVTSAASAAGEKQQCKAP